MSSGNRIHEMTNIIANKEWVITACSIFGKHWYSHSKSVKCLAGKIGMKIREFGNLSCSVFVSHTTIHTLIIGQWPKKQASTHTRSPNLTLICELDFQVFGKIEIQFNLIFNLFKRKVLVFYYIFGIHLF